MLNLLLLQRSIHFLSITVYFGKMLVLMFITKGLITGIFALKFGHGTLLKPPKNLYIVCRIATELGSSIQTQ